MSKQAQIMLSIMTLVMGMFHEKDKEYEDQLFFNFLIILNSCLSTTGLDIFLELADKVDQAKASKKWKKEFVAVIQEDADFIIRAVSQSIEADENLPLVIGFIQTSIVNEEFNMMLQESLNKYMKGVGNARGNRITADREHREDQVSQPDAQQEG